MRVSALGLGGFHLGSTRDQTEATEIVARAIDAGVNFFDNAWEYHDGESAEIAKSGNCIEREGLTTGFP